MAAELGDAAPAIVAAVARGVARAAPRGRPRSARFGGVTRAHGCGSPALVNE